ncbi:hypothetical protein BDV34DRAFT_231841 [Aspergillus parasiticus]|uniref:2-oxoadipate dioxygenase/decarboxylase n=1 Tax=Aspergillus parasiticus TaxID=5067 RepID=A0A5N6E5Y8_ASPPA|nr:hypothetical protein BDV34DRAFT_231841 [Aspergillus parasiticus]
MSCTTQPNGVPYLRPAGNAQGLANYPHARTVTAGHGASYIHISGTSSRRGDGSFVGAERAHDPNGNTSLKLDIRLQTGAVLKNIAAIIDGATEGRAGMQNVVEVTVFLTNMKDDYAGMNEEWNKVWPDRTRAPARTTVELLASANAETSTGTDYRLQIPQQPRSDIVKMQDHPLRQHVPSANIRQAFAVAISAMYAKEVPLYSDWLSLVQQSNQRVLESDPNLRQKLSTTDNLDRIHLERHGAIRVGRPDELNQVRRVLQVMNMLPTGYYDLAPANVPVHSTCFRAPELSELSKNAFRMFVSLLRPELIKSDEVRQRVTSILSRRRIFSERMFALLAIYESNGGLVEAEADEFVHEATSSFQWHNSAAVSCVEYQEMLSESAILADIVAFKSPHINHLTPRVLDIDAVQSSMRDWNIPVKDYIEGPPKRKCPILLRQTSFKAIEEPISFPVEITESANTKQFVPGRHKARFGEIEQRGAALTVKGRQLYDSLLAIATRNSITAGDTTAFSRVFASFPDSWMEMRELGLAWFRYYINPNKLHAQPEPKPFNLSQLIEDDIVRYEPIVYEDFLPISAAGIFRSNLNKNGDSATIYLNSCDLCSKCNFEKALGVEVADEMLLYQRIQDESIGQCKAWVENAWGGL